ncbi:SAM-like domain protein [Ranid herpesvirus 3]|uniref:SAM-like domain protein n=1 Tax=Ranid herpesvirus 3 TaxID=1987509 RepID=A0A1X9T582_9VIRU|nr:SAM-like domain protein [Ranid herpesvirus 3]ARR28859.1 SAM-like domain protein [Ranid herpesvirus 3]
MSLRSTRVDECNAVATEFFDLLSVRTKFTEKSFLDYMNGSDAPSYKTKEQVVQNADRILAIAKGLWAHKVWDGEFVLCHYADVQSKLNEVLEFCEENAFCLRHSVSRLHTVEGALNHQNSPHSYLIGEIALPLSPSSGLNANTTVASLVKLFGPELVCKVLDAELSFFVDNKTDRLPRVSLANALQSAPSHMKIASGHINHLPLYLYPVAKHPMLKTEALTGLLQPSYAHFLGLSEIDKNYSEDDKSAAQLIASLGGIKGVGPFVMKTILQEVRSVACKAGFEAALTTLTGLLPLLENKSVVILKRGIMCTSLEAGPISTDYIRKYEISPLFAIACHGKVMKTDARVVVYVGSHFFAKLVTLHVGQDCDMHFSDCVEPFFNFVTCTLCEEDQKCYVCV